MHTLQRDSFVPELIQEGRMGQVHKKFSDGQVKELMERYLRKEIERAHVEQILGIRTRRFFSLIAGYKKDPEGFSVAYRRGAKTRGIPDAVDELIAERDLIKNPDVPLSRYNYTYIKDRLKSRYYETVSLPTVIDRAKKHGCYVEKPKKRYHDREVSTHYAGQLIQHDASYHLWSPAAKEKWYLITSLDDYSRFILYGDFFEKETSLAHIGSTESVVLHYGVPFSYYVDSHSIFRFVQGRDSFWRKHHALTDERTPQWKQVLNDLNVKVIYALSPQAKGKIERPYQWLQDRVVRTCVREDVTRISEAKEVLRHELNRYNYHQVHSTTGEVPFVRLQNALAEKRSLFREFSVTPPFATPKDIFCIRIRRTVNPYRTVTLRRLTRKVNNADPKDILDIHIYRLSDDLLELRFWRKDQLVDVQTVKSGEL